MDYMFTQKELSYLDDIMPEIVKRSKEDGKDVNEVDEFAVRKLVRILSIFNTLGLIIDAIHRQHNQLFLELLSKLNLLNTYSQRTIRST
jgi:hypothetical protein